MTLAHRLAVTTSLLASTARGGRGTLSFRPTTRQPALPLRLYDYEASPYCRLVREALSEMDLDALILPCPKGGTRHRPEVLALGGRLRFPFLVDPNNGTQLFESAEIIDYLAETYGGCLRASRGTGRTLAVAASFAASTLRAIPRVRGTRAEQADGPSNPPQLELELYSFESSPYARLVRERLCELQLPYLLRNMAKARWEDLGPPGVRARLFPQVPVEGRNRLRLLALAGRVQVPYLIDPNTGTALFESVAILRYLNAQYGA